MRLLRVEDEGGFSLVEYIGDSPQYSVLSHTWGADDEEVTFKDLTEGCRDYKSKTGYRKLTFCAEQAVRDRLQFFWVDTCCIDKSSSAELSEAINSMFRWYHDAARCYVYLSDVSADGSSSEEHESEMRWHQAFKKSRWFTRGWTLQELIAPSSVEFFSKEGRQLGDKQSLETLLHEITGIPIAALRGSQLSRLSVVERFSWAAQRQTKREEDAAYSLLGIFDIHMPLIYGEGRQKAFERLQKKIEKPIRSLRRHIDQQTRKWDNLDTQVQQVVRQMEKRPKELGFPWETGVPEDHLKIDDGLGAEYLLPVDLCETPEAFFNLLKLKYESRKLPGLQQVQQGHILLWEWNERHLVTRANWLQVVKGDRAVKLSFIMGHWAGPPRNRCMRCFKPRTDTTSRSPFKHCNSCKLAVRWVEPDYLPFEPNDTTLLSRDTYRDYKAAARRSNVQGQPKKPAFTSAYYEKHANVISPKIDLVCHRLTMKWEPVYNVVYRYLYCRCVLRLNTPSRLVDEMTILEDAPCPRHNTQGITFRDYSELALPCQKDPYFDRFGGYDAFWALLHRHLPELYQHLGGDKCVPPKQLVHGYVDLLQLEESDEDAVRRIARGYWFELATAAVQQGADLPPDVAAEYTKEKTRRAEDVKEDMKDDDFDLTFDEEGNAWLRDKLAGSLQDMLQNSHLGEDVTKILNGNWDGIPHWKVKD